MAAGFSCASFSSSFPEEKDMQMDTVAKQVSPDGSLRNDKLPNSIQQIRSLIGLNTAQSEISCSTTRYKL